MSQEVVSGAMLMCTFGMTPSALTVIPKGQIVNAGGPMAANIMDNIPIANVPPFGMCVCHEPCRGSSHLGGDGRAYACAVRAYHNCPMGSRVA